MAPRAKSQDARRDREVRIVTLNISGPSAGRAEQLATYLIGLDADALVLTETRANHGTRLLLRSLIQAGYELVEPRGLTGSERGAVIAHRLPSLSSAFKPLVSLPHRLPVACVELGDRPTLLVGVYVPSRDISAQKIERKARFLRDLVGAASSALRAGSVILMGDLNVIARTHEPRYSAFRRWEYDALDQLLETGLLDAHELVAPGSQVHSWIGRRGHGYRYDYGFVSADLSAQVLTCAYDHDPRTMGLSDHAAVQLHVSASRDETCYAKFVGGRVVS